MNRNQASMLDFTITIQLCTGSPSQCHKARKNSERHVFQYSSHEYLESEI